MTKNCHFLRNFQNDRLGYRDFVMNDKTEGKK